jgi:PGF-pre-PGF domain-containing protein
MKDDLAGHYVLTQNIDMTGFGNFEPIGNNSNPFTGSLDGQNYTAIGLTIECEDFAGLFGNTSTDSIIKNVGLVNVNVTGNTYVGGLVGLNKGNITNAYSNGIVIGNNAVGGLVGLNSEGNVTNSYSNGNVISTNAYAGGLVGQNYGCVANSYSTTEVDGNNYVAGFAGSNSGIINDSYSTGYITGENGIGGFVSINSGTIEKSYWHKIENSVINGVGNQPDYEGVSGNSTNEMKSQGTYVGWDFTNTWKIHQSVNDGYPYLVSLFDSYEIFEGGDGSSDNPYQISNVIQLQAMTIDLYANYTLINDIDASETVDWNYNHGFARIGGYGNEFKGSFDGQNYTIFELYMNRPSSAYQSLFGVIENATISNVVMVNCDITGAQDVGGIVGQAKSSVIINSYSTGNVNSRNNVGGLVGNSISSTVENSYSTANVVGIHNGVGNVGGLVGRLDSSNINDSYSMGSVIGISSYGTTDNVGGLVGWQENSNITDSYSTGSVTSDGNNVGGFVGYSASSTVVSSYWDINTSRQTESSVGEGKTTLEMKNSSIYNDWDFTNIWNIHIAVNDGYPHLISHFDSYRIFEDGDGSFNNPYQISNVIQLQAVGLNLSANYILINDIDASETASWNDGAGFEPIANAYVSDKPTGDMFNGSFDGNDYHINDLFINRSNEDIIGLFGYLGPNSIIKNVIVHGNVTGGEEVVGILAGLNSGTIINSHSSGNVYGDLGIGGLIGYNGYNMNGTVENSSSSATVEGLGYIGGLVGYNDDAPIESSDASGIVKGLLFAGGLVGFNEGGNISNSSSTANVIENRTNTPENIGGLVGGNSGNIVASYAKGNVDASNSYCVGGLVGINIGTIAESFSSGDVIGNNSVGGLVGREGSARTIINSYSTSTVTGNDSVGGLVGTLEYGSIMDSYSIGEVTGVSNVGGLIGFNDSGTITESYWNTETSSQSESAAGEGKTTSQMKQQSAFIDWDFTNIWSINPRINNGYPYLQNLYDSYTVVEDDDVPQSSRSSRQQNIADSKSPSESIDTLFSNRQNVGVGSKVEYHVTADDIPVTLISFTSRTNEGIVENRINVLNNVPEGTPVNNAPVYKFMEINVGRTGTIGSHNADNILIHFKVSKKWIEENNIILESIRIERLSNGGWERLPTEQLDEDEEFFYFASQTTGFSIFAIAGDKNAFADETSILEFSDEEIIGIAADEEKSNLYVALGISIVTIVAIGFVFYKRKNKGLK